MENKEERILITKCSSSCHALHTAFGPVGDEENMYCDKSGTWVIITEKDCAKCKSPVLAGLSHTEAVEGMARALCNWYYTACSECALKDKPKECFRLLKDASFYEQAESALNALLEEHK